MIKYIHATVVYNEFEGGFWGLRTKEGVEYLPINMPRQLMLNGANVSCGIKPSDDLSLHMWGKLIEIVSFETIHK